MAQFPYCLVHETTLFLQIIEDNFQERGLQPFDWRETLYSNRYSFQKQPLTLFNTVFNN